MDITAIATELIAGGIGGNLAGVVLKNLNLGPIGNTIAGLAGGIGGGQLAGMLATGGAAVAAASTATGGGFDLGAMLPSIGGAGVGGAIVMAIAGLIKTQMAKSSA